MNCIVFLRGVTRAFAYEVGERADQEGTAIGRQDKSGSPVVIQAIDMAWISPCRTVVARAAPRQKANDFNDVYGTVRHVPPLASCQ